MYLPATNLFTSLALTCIFLLLPVRQNCITPENYYGSCVALSYCPQAAEVFQLTDRRTAENYVFALQRSCGTRSINRDPLVREDHSFLSIALLSSCVFCFQLAQVCCTRPVYNPVTERPSNPFFPPTEDSFVAPRPVTTQPPDRFNPFLQTSTERPRPIQTTTTAAPVTSAPLVEPRGPSCRIPPGKVGVCVGKLKQSEVVHLSNLYLSLSQTSSSVNRSLASCLCVKLTPSSRNM